eukprot:scaffold200511_cov29-Tisochrysis_lutea.AAC.3
MGGPLGETAIATRMGGAARICQDESSHRGANRVAMAVQVCRGHRAQNEERNAPDGRARMSAMPRGPPLGHCERAAVQGASVARIREHGRETQRGTRFLPRARQLRILVLGQISDFRSVGTVQRAANDHGSIGVGAVYHSTVSREKWRSTLRTAKEFKEQFNDNLHHYQSADGGDAASFSVGGPSCTCATAVEWQSSGGARLRDVDWLNDGTCKHV